MAIESIQVDMICRQYADRWHGNVDGRSQRTTRWMTCAPPLLLLPVCMNTAGTFHNGVETISSTSGHQPTPHVICLRWLFAC